MCLTNASRFCRGRITALTEPGQALPWMEPKAGLITELVRHAMPIDGVVCFQSPAPRLPDPLRQKHALRMVMHMSKSRICLYGPSALDAWRSYDNRVLGISVFGHTEGAGPALSQAFPSRALRSTADCSRFGLNSALLNGYDFGRWGIASSDLHLLISRDKRIRRPESAVLRTCGARLPRASFLQLDKGVFAISPEWCFLAAAEQRDFVELVMLGYELTGCYAIRPDLEGGLLQRPPLCTRESIRAFLDKVPAWRGKRQALKALDYVVGGSGSPRETALVMLLCLPMRYGGFGLPWPDLNLRLDLGAEGTRFWGGKNAYDLVWRDARVVVEYDGADSHAGEAVAERDSLRYDALVAASYTALTVSRSQLANVKQFYDIAHVLAGKLGVRLRFRDEGFRERHARLRQVVLGRHR